MSKQNQTAAKSAPKAQQKPTPAPIAEMSDDVALADGQLGGVGLESGLSLQGQAGQLADPRLRTTQRQAIAGQIGRVQGNHHLQRMVISLKRVEEKESEQSNKILPILPVTNRLGTNPTVNGAESVPMLPLAIDKLAASNLFNKSKRTDSRQSENHRSNGVDNSLNGAQSPSTVLPDQREVEEKERLGKPSEAMLAPADKQNASAAQDRGTQDVSALSQPETTSDAAAPPKSSEPFSGDKTRTEASTAETIAANPKQPTAALLRADQSPTPAKGQPDKGVTPPAPSAEGGGQSPANAKSSTIAGTDAGKAAPTPTAPATSTEGAVSVGAGASAPAADTQSGAAMVADGASSGGGVSSAPAASAGGGGESLEDSVVAADPAMEEAAGMASSVDAQLSPGERSAGMAGLTEGGGEASVGGGSGGGGAIEEKPVPPTPDVASTDPAQALATVGALPPAQLQTGLAGVSASVGRSVGEQRQALADNPPTQENLLDTPTGGAEASGSGATLPNAPSLDSVERTPEGQDVTAPTPEPLPPTTAAPTDAVPEPKVSGGEQGAMSADGAKELKTSVRKLPTHDAELAVDAGEPPPLSLEGNADPGQVREQQGELSQTISKAHSAGLRDVAQPMGENNVYPTVPQAPLKAKVQGGGGQRANGAVATMAGGGVGASGGEAAANGDAVSIIAQEQQGATIQAAVTQAQAEIAAQKQTHATEVANKRAAASQEINQLKTENSQQQAKARADVQADVQKQRQDWSKEQQAVVDHAQADSSKALQEGEGKITLEKNTAETEAAAHIKRGNQEAAEARQEAEANATQERNTAEKESDGVLGWLASKAKAFFDQVKENIRKGFELARKLVRKAIETAKRLAVEAIEKARKAIVGIIRGIGKALIAIGDTLLAAFPETRDRYRKAIQARVDQAEAAVNKLADDLKAGVQKALDFLGGALDAALGLLEKGMLAAVDAANATVQGAIKAADAVVQAVGAFAALIKDVAANPGQWISNLGAAVMDGISNHLWKAFKSAVQNWFSQKVEEVLGLGTTIWKLLTGGGMALAEIGKMAWEAIKQAIPGVLIQLLIEKVVSMIVPAAGAVMAIIEGLQAAWGTVSRIIQAFQAFMGFLKAVKTGGAGPQFSNVLASAGVVLIDFVANWLLRRLRKPASKVAGKLRSLAQRIGRKIKAVAKKVGRSFKKFGKKVKAGWKKLTGKFKKNKSVKNKQQKAKKEDKKQKDQARLDKAVAAIKPKINQLLQRGVSGLRLRAQLGFWQLKYRLKSLKLMGQGDNASVVATINPSAEVVRDIVNKHGETLLRMIRLIGRELLRSSKVREELTKIIEQRASGRGEHPDNPIIVQPGVGFPAQAADVAGVARPPGIAPPPGSMRPSRSTEYMELSGIPVEERQTWSSGPGHIETKGLGKHGTYDDIIQIWTNIGQTTASSDAEIAAALKIFRQTGVIDPKFGAYHEQFAALTRLSAVEMGRSPAQVATDTMAMELVEKGEITGREGVQDLNARAAKGAVRADSAVAEKVQIGSEREYKSKPKAAQVNSMIETELELMTRYLYSKMRAEQPLFKNAGDLDRFIRKELKDYLHNEIRVRMISGKGGA